MKILKTQDGNVGHVTQTPNFEHSSWYLAVILDFKLGELGTFCHVRSMEYGA